MPNALRSAAAVASGVRVLFGLYMTAKPADVGETWIGETGRYESVTVLTRAIGARDIGFGLGSAAALVGRRDDQAAIWLGVSALGDLIDLGALLAVRDRLPDKSVAMIGPIAAGSAAIMAAGAVAAARG